MIEIRIHFKWFSFKLFIPMRRPLYTKTLQLINSQQSFALPVKWPNHWAFVSADKVKRALQLKPITCIHNQILCNWYLNKSGGHQDKNKLSDQPAGHIFNLYEYDLSRFHTNFGCLFRKVYQCQIAIVWRWMRFIIFFA